MRISKKHIIFAGGLIVVIAGAIIATTITNQTVNRDELQQSISRALTLTARNVNLGGSSDVCYGNCSKIVYFNVWQSGDLASTRTLMAGRLKELGLDLTCPAIQGVEGSGLPPAQNDTDPAQRITCNITKGSAIHGTIWFGYTSSEANETILSGSINN